MRTAAGLAAVLSVAVPASAQAAPPPGRGYELVSPPDKAGAIVAGGQTSPSGDTLNYISTGPLPGGHSAGLAGNLNQATRTATGWTTRPLTPATPVTPTPPMGASSFVPMFSSVDLSKSVFSSMLPFDAVDDDADPYNNLYGNSDLFLVEGAAAPLRLSTGPNDENAGTPAVFAGATGDAGVVAFASQEDLLGDLPVLQSTPNGVGEYLYVRRGGELEALNHLEVEVPVLDEEGNPVLDDQGNPVVEIQLKAAVLGDGWYVSDALKPSIYGVTTNAISNDGSKVFYESPAPGAGGGGGAEPVHLWMRDGDDVVQIDLPAGTEDARYEGASVTGSRVFFRTAQAIDAADVDTTTDLYAYDTAAGTTSLLTGGGAAGAKLEGVTAIANDGSKLFFVANAALATGATEDAHNLYVRDVAAGTTTFIANVTDADLGDYEWEDPAPTVPLLAGGPDLSRGAIPTADGSVLAFVSGGDLTGENDTGYGQVYRYVTATGDLECVSCPEPGTAGGTATLGGAAGGSYHPAGENTAISADGSKVYFQTPDGLVTEDINGSFPPVGGIFGPTRVSHDVYEWNAGAVTLLSSGRSAAPTTLAGATEDGANVFINTYERLVPQDVDGEADIYDVRTGGGFPAPPPPAQECDGEACHGALGTTPFFPVPGTAQFEGPGNRAEDVSAIPLTVRSLTDRQRRRFASTGAITLRATVAEPGRIAVQVLGKLRKGGATQVLGQARKRARKAGDVRIPLKLGGAARAALRKRALKVRIQVLAGGGALTASVTLPKTTKNGK
jgi:hypothetical protein